MPMTTGDPHFNYLFGGFSAAGIQAEDPKDGLSGTTVVIEGFAGTGKTVLACQLCTSTLQQYWTDKKLAHATVPATDMPVSAPILASAVIYSLEQPAAEIRTLITSFGFLPAGSVIDAVDFLEPIPAGNGLFIKEVPLGKTTCSDLWQRIQLDTQASNVKLIVVDTINSVLKQQAGDKWDEEFRKLLQLACKPYPAHLILTLEKAGLGYDMEEYVPRCVIELNKVSEPSPGRTLEIKKARGQEHFIGPHDFEIISPTAAAGTKSGINVFPSLHARSVGTRVPGTPASTPGNISFGVPQIDSAIAPGLKEGSTTLLWGPPGAYKTELCAKFLAQGLRTERDSRALFITFKIEETAFRDILSSEGATNDFNARTEVIDARNPFELPTSVITRIIDYVRDPKGQPFKRAVVFGLRRLTQLPAYKESEWPFLEVLANFLRQQAISTLLIDWPEESKE